MESTLRQLILDYWKEQGWDDNEDSNESLYETFECFDVVYRGDPDEHRWYTLYDAVREVPNGQGGYRYFEDTLWSIDGDNCASDCGWECPNIDDIVEVYPVEVKAIRYVREEQLNNK